MCHKRPDDRTAPGMPGPDGFGTIQVFQESELISDKRLASVISNVTAIALSAVAFSIGDHTQVSEGREGLNLWLTGRCKTRPAMYKD